MKKINKKPKLQDLPQASKLKSSSNRGKKCLLLAHPKEFHTNTSFIVARKISLRTER